MSPPYRYPIILSWVARLARRLLLTTHLVICNMLELVSDFVENKYDAIDNWTAYSLWVFQHPSWYDRHSHLSCRCWTALLTRSCHFYLPSWHYSWSKRLVTSERCFCLLRTHSPSFTKAIQLLLWPAGTASSGVPSAQTTEPTVVFAMHPTPAIDLGGLKMPASDTDGASVDGTRADNDDTARKGYPPGFALPREATSPPPPLDGTAEEGGVPTSLPLRERLRARTTGHDVYLDAL
jgi:hypothetical protein